MRRVALAGGLVLAIALPSAAVSGSASTGAAAKRVHATVRLPKAGEQGFGLFRVRVRTAKGAPAPRIRVSLGNLAHMPPGIRAAAARTKPVRSGSVWSFELLVAINNLGSARALQEADQVPGAADLIIEVFSGAAFNPDREFVDDCLTRAEQRAWDRARKLIAVYFALGTWPSSPQEIFVHVLQDEKARCP